MAPRGQVEEAADEGSSVVVLGGAATGDLHTQEEYATEMAAGIVALLAPVSLTMVLTGMFAYTEREYGEWRAYVGF